MFESDIELKLAEFIHYYKNGGLNHEYNSTNVSRPQIRSVA